MARAKYKLETLVEITRSGQPSCHDQVDGILQTADGIRYRLKGQENTFVDENEITKAYRPVRESKPKARMVKASAPRARKGSDAQEARAN